MDVREALERHRSLLPALFRECVVVDVSSEECTAELSRAQAAQSVLKGFEQRANRPAIENRWPASCTASASIVSNETSASTSARHFMSKKAYQDAAVLYRMICSTSGTPSQEGSCVRQPGSSSRGALAWHSRPHARQEVPEAGMQLWEQSGLQEVEPGQSLGKGRSVSIRQSGAVEGNGASTRSRGGRGRVPLAPGERGPA